MNANPPISGAVLAGGASRRMGTDKALLTFDGEPLLARALRVLRAVTDDVYVVGDRREYHAFGARVVADCCPGAGSLGGIVTALHVADTEHVLVVGCDMPFLNVELLRAMIAEPRDYDALVPVVPGDGGQGTGDATWETLHAIYGRGALPNFVRRVEAGDLKVVAALAGVRVRTLDASFVRRYDPLFRSFINVNRPEELEAAWSLTSHQEIRRE